MLSATSPSSRSRRSMLAFPTGRLDRAGPPARPADGLVRLVGPPLVAALQQAPAAGLLRRLPARARSSSRLARRSRDVVELVGDGLHRRPASWPSCVVLVRRWRAATAPGAAGPPARLRSPAAATLVAAPARERPRRGHRTARRRRRRPAVPRPLRCRAVRVPVRDPAQPARPRLGRRADGRARARPAAARRRSPTRSATRRSGSRSGSRTSSAGSTRDGRALDLSLVPGAGDHASSSATAAGSARSCTTSRWRPSPSSSRASSAAVAFALDNERLQAELRRAERAACARSSTRRRACSSPSTPTARIRTPQPGDRRGERLRRRRGGPRARYFWDVFIDPGERDGDGRALPRRRARPPARPSTRTRSRTRAASSSSIIWRGAPVHGETGEVESIVAAGLDVTEHRRAGGGDPRLARPHRRGRRRGAPPARAEPPRRRAAAPRLALARAAARAGEARDATRRPRREILDGRERGARAGARGAARARPRDPPGGAHRPRPRRRARGARGADAARRSSSSRVGRRLPGADRGGRVLRRLRGGRRTSSSTRARRRSTVAARGGERHVPRSRSPTTASAAPTRPPARACAASPTGVAALDGRLARREPAGRRNARRRRASPCPRPRVAAE